MSNARGGSRGIYLARRVDAAQYVRVAFDIAQIVRRPRDILYAISIIYDIPRSRRRNARDAEISVTRSNFARSAGLSFYQIA